MKQLFIGGAWVAPCNGESLAVIAPATGETFDHIARGTKADIDLAVRAARAALDGQWGKISALERGRHWRWATPSCSEEVSSTKTILQFHG